MGARDRGLGMGAGACLTVHRVSLTLSGCICLKRPADESPYLDSKPARMSCPPICPPQGSDQPRRSGWMTRADRAIESGRCDLQ